MRYDLHLHSCLSPCAEDEMTPEYIAGFAKLNKIDLIAVTDHNSALNLPAAQAACNAYGLRLLPGIETNTAEEIHVLTYFKDLDAALAMGELLWQSLPDIPRNSAIWGRQLVVDEEGGMHTEEKKLLTAASSLTIYEIKNACEALGGIAIPAHVDRDSYSLLSVLGFAPEDLPFAAYEVARPEHTLTALTKTGRLPAGQEILTSSDAHSLIKIAEYPRELPAQSCLWRLLE